MGQIETKTVKIVLIRLVTCDITTGYFKLDIRNFLFLFILRLSEINTFSFLLPLVIPKHFLSQLKMVTALCNS